jgi:uncharacterized protein (UPF0333 family)
MELALILLIVLIAVSAILYAGWNPQKSQKKPLVAAAAVAEDAPEHQHAP